VLTTYQVELNIRRQLLASGTPAGKLMRRQTQTILLRLQLNLCDDRFRAPAVVVATTWTRPPDDDAANSTSFRTLASLSTLQCAVVRLMSSQILRYWAAITAITDSQKKISFKICQVCKKIIKMPQLQRTIQYRLCHTFLADRTNGRAYATVLRPSVCLSSSVVCNVMYCGWTVRRRAKVTIESL